MVMFFVEATRKQQKEQYKYNVTPTKKKKEI